LVDVLGALMVFLVIARIYSTIVDGVPGRASKIYLGVEAISGAIFLAWPPPVGL
jgi:hypothetical protein